MKKLLGIALALLPSLCFADRLGSLRSSADVLLSTQGANSSSVIHSTGSLQSGATFYVSSGTVQGPLYINGGGNGLIQLTISGSTTAVISSTGSYSVGQGAVFSSTNGTVIGGTSGVAVGGSGTQLQYRVDATTLGGVPNSSVWASSFTVSTMGVLVNGGQTANTGLNGTGGPGVLDVFVGSPYTSNRTLFAVGSGAQANQFYVPNNNQPVATLGIQAGQLIVGDTSASGQRIYSNGDPNSFFDLRNGSSATWNTGTANGKGDIRIAPASVIVATFSRVDGITLGTITSTVTIPGVVTASTIGIAGSDMNILANVNASTFTVFYNATVSANTGLGVGPGILDVYSGPSVLNKTLFSVGSSARSDQFYVPNNAPVVAILGLEAGQLILGDANAVGQRIYSNGDTNSYFDLRNGSTATLNTGTADGPGDIRFQPGGVLKATISKNSGVTMDGVNISSGVNINIPAVITGTSTITSSMTVVVASCTTRGASPNAWITLNLGSANNAGEEHFIYNVGADSCSIKIAAQPGDLIESSGTVRLDAQTQHASIHALGGGLWGAGPGSIQYTPWSIFTTQDDVGTFTVATASDVYSCPIYVPVPVGFMGVRLGRSTSSGFVGTAITDMNGKYVVGVSSMITVTGMNNYFTGSVFQLAPGWYRAEVVIPNTVTAINGSNTVSSSKAFCSKVGTSTFGSDLSTFVPTLPGTGDTRSYPAFDLLINGGLQGF